MALPTISAGDLMGKGVTGMPANPELSVADLQAKFDELSLDVIVPKIQALVNALEGASAGADLGVTAPTGITASNKVKSVLDAMAVILLAIKNKSDVDYDNLVTLLTGITSVSNIVDGLTTTIPTAKAITDFIQDIGGGDMLRTTYDTNLNGIVDNSERLGNQLPAFYAKQQDLTDAGAVVADLQADVLDLQTDVGNLTPVVLWTNSNPTSSFAGQTVNLSEALENFSKYEIIGIIGVDAVSAAFRVSTGKVDVGFKTWFNQTLDNNYARAITNASGTSVTFDDAYTFGHNGTKVVSNINMIPTKIIGYK